MGTQYRGIMHAELLSHDDALLQKVQDAILLVTNLDPHFHGLEQHVSYLGHKGLQFDLDASLGGFIPIRDLIHGIANCDPEQVLAVMWIDCDTLRGDYKFRFSDNTTLVQATQMRTGFLERVKENVRRIEATLPFAEGADPAFEIEKVGSTGLRVFHF